MASRRFQPPQPRSLRTPAARPTCSARRMAFRRAARVPNRSVTPALIRHYQALVGDRGPYHGAVVGLRRVFCDLRDAGQEPLQRRGCEQGDVRGRKNSVAGRRRGSPCGRTWTLPRSAGSAWSHESERTWSVDAWFLALAASSFTTFGASPSANSALVSVGAEMDLGLQGCRQRGRAPVVQRERVPRPARHPLCLVGAVHVL